MERTSAVDSTRRTPASRCCRFQANGYTNGDFALAVEATPVEMIQECIGPSLLIEIHGLDDE